MWETVLIVFSGINVSSFFLMGFDKWRAIRKKHRLSEKSLYLISLCFGSLGVLIGMFTFRHKVSKTSFQFTLAVIILIQVGLLAWYVGVL
jgi:uncharacterized membrane protein YsdA (DUF1294 family)